MRLSAAVLAGGISRRFGADKLRVLLNARPLLAYALDAAAAAPADDLIVAAGSQDVAETVIEWTRSNRRLPRIIPVDTGAEGIGGSLRAVVAALGADCEGLFAFLGDMPLVPPDVAPRLVEALQAGALAAAPTHRGLRGHPVLLGRSLFADLGHVSGDRGAAALLAGCATVPTDDDGVLFDVDTPAAALEAESRLAIGQNRPEVPPSR